MHAAFSSTSSRHISWQWAIPATAILLVQIALYAWMAPRGFEFTDEAYYFHNFLYWREFTGTVTFFGAYFEWPFRAMGMSLGGIRLLSLALVLASGGVLMHAVLRFSLHGKSSTSDAYPTIPYMGWYLVAPMASAMLYFGYLATLRAPSYNLLSLFTISMCTACMLRTVEQLQTKDGQARLASFLYGLALGACFLSKATTSAFMLLGHLTFFIAVNRTWNLRRLMMTFVLIVLGVLVNFVLLTLEFPAWISNLREGVAIMGTRSNYGIGQMLLSLRWDVQNAIERTGLFLVSFGLLLFFIRRKLIAYGAVATSVVALVFVAASAIGMLHEKQTRLWLVGMAAAAAALWFLERLGRSAEPLEPAEKQDLALVTLLFYLPVAFSFGSNMSVFGHSAMASVFPFCAVYLGLYKLAHERKLTRAGLAIATSMLCVPALLTQVWALTDAEHTYRQLSGLSAQTIPVKVGAPSSQIWVDTTAGKSLRDIATMSARAGFTPGADILDLTGDGPGFIYAVGARPLGTPWMLGGYPGSDAAAARIIGKISTASLRQTWLLTSLDNPLRVRGWDALLAQRIGPGTHELAGSTDVANPYAFTPTAPKMINLQLWRPVKH